MARGVDLLRLLDGPVVQPQDDIAVVPIVSEVRAGDGDRLVRVVREDGEGACRVEAEALDAAGVDQGVLHHLLHTVADGIPDVGSGLLL